MKKLIAFILCTVMAASMVCMPVNAETVTYDNYDIIKEVSMAYARKGMLVHYDQLNGRRHIYASPEVATAQRTLYLDCSSFINACYLEAFGENILPFEIREMTANTANFTKYAKENPTNKDVIGYWENADYATEEERKAVLATVRENLQIGDLLVYRKGTSGGTSGHCYIYIGNDEFLHCFGGGSFTRNAKNPSLSYDSRGGELAGVNIATIKADSIFTDKTHERYLFVDSGSSKVWQFALLRPFERGLVPTEETLNRMKIAGLSMEKVSSVYENNSVNTGDVITYSIKLENTNNTELSDVELKDTIPAGTEFVSAAEGVKNDGQTVSWNGSVPAESTVTLTYDVKVTATEPGTLIKSEETFVSGVKLGNIVHTLSPVGETDALMLKEKAIEFSAKRKTFENGAEMASSIYKEALGTDLFENLTEKDILDQIIDVENKELNSQAELSKMVAPNLYGGHLISAGWVYKPEQTDRTRFISKEELMTGDIIVADWSGGSNVWVYLGGSEYAIVEDGVCKLFTNGDNPYGVYADDLLITLLAYDRFAVLRPSMTNISAKNNVEGISVTAFPAKVNYRSGEKFDPTGMVVTAQMSDKTNVEIKGYTVSPETLEYTQNSVTVSFGKYAATVNVNVSANENKYENIGITIDGKEKEFDVMPVMKNDRVLVPMRAIFEELGATVEWDDALWSVTATKGETKLLLLIGRKSARINKEDVELDVAPEIINGRTMVPVRFVAETLGCSVDWNDKAQTVIIRSEGDNTTFDGKKVLFIGNEILHIGRIVDSYGKKVTDFESRLDVKCGFNQLCKANGQNVEVRNWTFTSHNLSDIMSEEECSICANHPVHLNDLTDKNFDYVFVSPSMGKKQEESFLADMDNIKKTFEEANPNVEIIVLGNIGAYKNSWNGYKPGKMVSNYSKLEAKGIKVLDIGKIITDVVTGKYVVPGSQETFNQNTFITRDGVSANLLTGYITALFAYCEVTGESAVGQPYGYMFDTSLAPCFDIPGYVIYYYQNDFEDTNFEDILASESEMKCIQQMVDDYLN